MMPSKYLSIINKENNGLEHDKLQESMDEFTELLLKTPRDKVQAFTTYVREKY